MRSKIDQSDPNPAHKLQHSVADLTIDSKQGREINPRFSSSISSKPRPVFRRGRTVDYNEFPHSSSPAEYRYQRSASVDTPTGPAQAKLASTFPLRKARVPRVNKMSRIAERETPMPASQDIFEEAEEDELLSGATVGSEELSQRGSTAFTESGLAEEAEALEEVGIYGMEVTSNNTETTVVLKHLLALADKSSTKSSDMTIIEEDELEEEETFYESQDTPTAKSSSPFSLAHPIPRLIVTNEEGELVETVVENTRVYTPGLCTDGAVTQSKFAFAVEEIAEEEEDVLSTRL